MAEVKWIKITTDIFDDEKILLIESMPSADSIIVIWFKLLTFAGKQNNDGVFLMSNRIAYTEEMLASIFRRDINTVRLALNIFEQFGMIEIVNNVITIPNWNKHQTLDAYEKKKARDRLYMQERRAAQKAIAQESSYKSSDSKTTGSSYVAISDKEEDKEEDKEIESKDAPVALPAPKRKVFQKPSLEDIKAYCKEGGYSIDAQRFLDYYESNGWMVGRNKMKDWKAAVRSWASRDKKPQVERDYGDPEDFYK